MRSLTVIPRSIQTRISHYSLRRNLFRVFSLIADRVFSSQHSQKKRISQSSSGCKGILIRKSNCDSQKSKILALPSWPSLSSISSSFSHPPCVYRKLGYRRTKLSLRHVYGSTRAQRGIRRKRRARRDHGLRDDVLKPQKNIFK